MPPCRNSAKKLILDDLVDSQSLNVNCLRAVCVPNCNFIHMIPLITIFYLSFILTIFMLYMKHLELVAGKKYFLTNLADKNDHIFEKLHADIRTGISYFNKHTFIAFVQWVAAGMLSWLRN